MIAVGIIAGIVNGAKKQSGPPGDRHPKRPLAPSRPRLDGVAVTLALGDGDGKWNGTARSKRAYLH